MVKTGDPVVLTSAEGLGDTTLSAGDKGWANSVVTVPGDKTYAFFIKEGTKEMVVLDAERLTYDEDRDGLVLDENTIQTTVN